jgi:hypothetical protein
MSIVRSPVRSVVRSPVQGVFGGSASLLEQATSALGNVAPYHYLDFINNRALYASTDVGNVTGATGYSFTRASDGYYQNADGTLTLFGSGALRRGDRGVLIEGSRTNLLLQSQTFDNASWSLDDTLAFGSGSVANAIAAPDGTVTADLIVPTTSNVGTHRIRQAQVTATVAHCIVWFVKAGGYSKAGIREGNITGAYATFNLSGAGTVLDSGSGGTGSIRALANGWYQIVLAFTAGATARADLHVLADGYTTGSPASYSYAGNGTSGLYIWQADLQAGAFPSSPIVTVAAAATRASDVLSYTVNTTAQINAAVAGQAELVTNGTFDTDTGWTKGAGWTITGGAAVATAVAPTIYIEPSVPLSVTAGRWYAVSFTATVSSGGVGARLGGVVGTARTSSGTYVELFFATSTANLQFERRINDFTGTIDNVSVKEVPANSLTLYPLSLWAEFERAVDAASNDYIFQIENGPADRIGLLVSSGNVAGAAQLSGNVLQAALTVSGALALNTVYKSAARSALNDVQMARGGTLATADTSASVPAAPNLLRVGSFNSSSDQLFGYIRRAAVFTTALTDAQLQTVTT